MKRAKRQLHTYLLTTLDIIESAMYNITLGAPSPKGIGLLDV